MICSRRDLIAAAGVGLAGLGTPVTAQPRAVTPTQRIGPFYPVVAEAESRVDLTRKGSAYARAKGQVIDVSGRVLDPQGRPIGSAIVLVWQADAAGRYDHPADTARPQRDAALAGHALLRTTKEGTFHLRTVRPGAYADLRSRSGLRTPHIHYEIIGEEGRLITEMYFPEEPLNDADPNIAEMLAAGADPRLLTARLDDATPPEGVMSLRWDIVLSQR